MASQHRKPRTPRAFHLVSAKRRKKTKTLQHLQCAKKVKKLTIQCSCTYQCNQISHNNP